MSTPSNTQPATCAPGPVHIVRFADTVERVAAQHDFDIVNPAAIYRGVREVLAWALLDQTCDLADRAPSDESVTAAQAAADAIMAAFGGVGDIQAS